MKMLGVIGPTASGKTGLAIALAKQYNGEVVSCDSMQVYKGMDIGSAKPDAMEQQGVRHHMLDVAAPHEPYCAARYAKEASACIEDICGRGRLPILCGGTGLYLNALLGGLHDALPVTGEQTGVLRQQLMEQLAREGTLGLYTELKQVDPDSALRIHPNDSKRVMRALEVYRQTGVPLSEHHAQSQLVPKRYDALLLGLRFADRQVLGERITKRVAAMMQAGLLEEVRTLLAQSPPPCATALQAIGYKELIPVVQGTLSPEEGAQLVALHTRQLAKRQMTWFNKTPDVHWLEADKLIFEQATQIVEHFGLR